MAQSGIAPIKPQYLISAPVKTLNITYVSNGDKKRLASEVADSGDSSNQESANRAKKLKGQNKTRRNEMHKGNRERNKPSVRICHKFVAGGIDKKRGCEYGHECTFSHDLEAYLAECPQKDNISGECYAFSTFGFCQRGAMCRFSAAHLNEDKTNKVDEEKWAQWEDKISSLSKNVLSKELMITLRRKGYNFKEANEIIKKVDRKGGPEQGKVEKVDPPPELEKRKVDFANKLYLAPLTTVGNLPFRRICKEYGADITCGEMAMAQQLLDGHQPEWALLRRHASEDVFGVQVCGAFPDQLTRVGQLIRENCDVDFVDLNMGCPIDLVYKRGAGSGLMTRTNKLNNLIDGMYLALGDIPLTIKMRTGVQDKKNIATKVIEQIKERGAHRVALYTVHGRSREARYTRSADWAYIEECARAAAPTPLIGSGDIMSYDDLNERITSESPIAGCMLARGALIKPWVFTELKERRHWDISSSERFDILKKYTNYGLEHWGSDEVGVEKTRRFLLEWLSFLHRYIPVGVLEVVPQRINERPFPYVGRDDLETLMASSSCEDWIKISTMLLGPAPDDFVFLPKHKANAYSYSSGNERSVIVSPVDALAQTA